VWPEKTLEKFTAFLTPHLRRIAKELSEQKSDQELLNLIQKYDNDIDGAEEFYQIMTRKI
jgi:Ca2+-binding EF-hand superfamily protein